MHSTVRAGIWSHAAPASPPAFTIRFMSSAVAAASL